MTNDEREKMINDVEIAILKEGVGTILNSTQLSRMARAALAIAEAAFAKSYPWTDFAAHTNWEIKYKKPIYGDDADQERCWVVFEETGNRNDREWTVIGKGDTPAAAAQSALKYDAEREQKRADIAAAILASIPEKKDDRA